MNRGAVESFEGRVCEHLRAAFASYVAVLDDAALVRAVGGAIERALEHGLTTELDVARFVEYVAVYGPEFARDETTAWAAEILARSDLDATTRMDLIDDREAELL